MQKRLVLNIQRQTDKIIITNIEVTDGDIWLYIAMEASLISII